MINEIFDELFSEEADEVFEESLFGITNPSRLNKEADDVFEEAGLSDSMVFQKLNDSSSITTRIAEIIKTGVVVEKEYIEEQYSQIAKTHLSPLVDKVLSAYDAGDIVLIYNKKKHLTIALPFTIMKMGGKMKAVIFISDFSGLNKEGTALNIEMKKLYTLMEAGYVALNYTANPQLFTRSSTIAKLTAEVYAEMGLRILNREFALSLEKDSHDMINYGLARFYLEKVFGMTSLEVIHSYAVGVCKSPDNTAMNYVQGLYDTHTINTASDLIAFFVELYPKMDKLTFRYYFERWVSSYAIGATLAIDNFTYLYYVIISVLLGSFMVNNTALNDLVKNIKGMKNFYGEISRVTGGN
jgi:hypothetical protein